MAVRAILGRVLRGLRRALAAGPGRFAAVAGLVLALQVVLPPLVLSLARKPVDFATFNPWLVRLPDYLASGAPLGEKLGKVWGLALFWFSSSNPYGIEWGFAVDVGALVRMLGTSLLVAAYFALASLRARLRAADRAVGAAGVTVRSPGAVGAVASVLGLSTGPCSVMGCGAPVLPVVGLAFAGLSSTTLVWLARVSSGATAAVLGVLALGVGWLAWTVGAAAGPSRPAR
jgi:hypothetical protein